MSGTELDFTAPRAIGPTRLDTAYTSLAREDDGSARVSLDDPVSGRSLSLWMDRQFDYVMCYTGDGLDDPARRRAGLAVEPMTCPPDAFGSGRGLIVLEPGAAFSGSWGIVPR